MEAVINEIRNSHNTKLQNEEEDESIKSVLRRFNKVTDWLKKNEENSEYFWNYIEESSVKSSIPETISSINTPLLSEDEAIIELKKQDYRGRNKCPVKPVELFLTSLYDVSILNFESFESFFVLVKRKSERKWNRLMRRLQKLRNLNDLERLRKVQQGSLCLILSNDTLHRVIIQNHDPLNAVCFGIDNGEFYILDATKDHIYVMTPKIRNTVEFQAVNCKLFNVSLPISRDVTKLIYETFISKIKNPQIKVIGVKPSRYFQDNCVPFDTYEVLLFDDHSYMSINEVIGFQENIENLNYDKFSLDDF